MDSITGHADPYSALLYRRLQGIKALAASESTWGDYYDLRDRLREQLADVREAIREHRSTVVRSHQRRLDTVEESHERSRRRGFEPSGCLAGFHRHGLAVAEAYQAELRVIRDELRAGQVEHERQHRQDVADVRRAVKLLEDIKASEARRYS